MGEIDNVTWYAMKVLLWLGGSSVVAVIAILGGMFFYAGYVVGGLGRKERPMEAQKMDHIKTDILPDGSLTDGDRSN